MSQDLYRFAVIRPLQSVSSAGTVRGVRAFEVPPTALHAALAAAAKTPDSPNALHAAAAAIKEHATPVNVSAWPEVSALRAAMAGQASARLKVLAKAVAQAGEGREVLRGARLVLRPAYWELRRHTTDSLLALATRGRQSSPDAEEIVDLLRAIGLIEQLANATERSPDSREASLTEGPVLLPNDIWPIPALPDEDKFPVTGPRRWASRLLMRRATGTDGRHALDDSSSSDLASGHSTPGAGGAATILPPPPPPTTAQQPPSRPTEWVKSAGVVYEV